MVHPYIPNSVPQVKDEMLKEIGVKNIEELLNIIPGRLRFKKRLNLPKPFHSEHELRRHIEEMMVDTKTCREYLNFLGAGCWQHYVPAVVDEIINRAEFLTAYAADTYGDLGKLQAFFEFQSMMGELLDMDVVMLPIYDWGSAAGLSVRMASRITGRNEILVSRTTSPERLSIIKNLCQPEVMPGHMKIKLVDFDPRSGQLNLDDLSRKMTNKTAAIYFENPSYFGLIEPNGDEITKLAHDNGALCVVGVDPISLGVISPPAHYGGDIVCGEIQPLGIHMYYGGGLGGFIASSDDVKFVSQYPSFLVSAVKTEREGELGFGFCMHKRTLYMKREQGRDFTGTSVGLWTIAAAVYLALMGPEGMREIGESIIQRSHYAAKLLSDIKGVKVLFSSNFFKEFVVNFDGAGKKVSKVNKTLLRRKIFGGKDITAEFPEMGSSSLYCVTEVHAKEDLERLADAVENAVRSVK